MSNNTAISNTTNNNIGNNSLARTIQLENNEKSAQLSNNTALSTTKTGSSFETTNLNQNALYEISNKTNVNCENNESNNLAKLNNDSQILKNDAQQYLPFQQVTNGNNFTNLTSQPITSTPNSYNIQNNSFYPSIDSSIRQFSMYSNTFPSNGPLSPKSNYSMGHKVGSNKDSSSNFNSNNSNFQNNNGSGK
jgi:hypothetical protein